MDSMYIAPKGYILKVPVPWKIFKRYFKKTLYFFIEIINSGKNYCFMLTVSESKFL